MPRHFAPIGLIEARENTHQRGFARTIGTDQSDVLSRPNLEAHSLQDGSGIELPEYFLEREQNHRSPAAAPDPAGQRRDFLEEDSRRAQQDQPKVK